MKGFIWKSFLPCILVFFVLFVVAHRDKHVVSYSEVKPTKIVNVNSPKNINELAVCFPKEHNSTSVVRVNTEKNINESSTSWDAKEQKITKLILVTYYRSGSTFLGQLFNQNPDAFYWFEPLHNFYLSLYRFIDKGIKGSSYTLDTSDYAER